MTHWVHPQVIGSLVSLLGQAGATRIRLLESAPMGTKPLEEFMIAAGWQPKDFAARPRGSSSKTPTSSAAERPTHASWFPAAASCTRATT